MAQLREYLAPAIAWLNALRERNRLAFNAVLAAIGAAATLGAVFYLVNPGAPVVLAGNLGAADRTALALRLRRHSIPFTLGADSITVSARDLYHAQHLIESAPPFGGGGNDFELFDRSTLGMSDFDEQVNYQRSVQGELERTIMSIKGVDNARVMLAMAHPSPFALGQSEAAHAAVMLTMTPGAVPDLALARAIAHLVAGAVRGLKPEDVTITASDGEVLFPGPSGGEAGEDARVRNEVERRLRDKLSAILQSVMGEGRYAVEVSVEMDNSHITSREERFANSDSAVLSEERSSEPVAAAPAGIPGLTSNLPQNQPAPAPAAAAPAGSSAQPSPSPAPPELAKKESLTYKPSVQETTTTSAPVRIRRLSVAAVLDGTYDGGVFKPLPPDRIKALAGLLAAAAGVQTARGDFIDVQSAPLLRPYVPPPPNPLAVVNDLVRRYGYYFYAAIGGGALLLIIGLWLIARLLFRRKPKPAAKAEVEAPAAAIAETSAPPPDAAPTQASAVTLLTELIKRANAEAEKNPQAVASLIRRWMEVPPALRPAPPPEPASADQPSAKEQIAA